MIYSSLAVLALSASAAVNPLTNLIHLHPRAAQQDTRVTVQLFNRGVGFRDVRIGGNLYTVEAHQTLNIKAPVGTVIYAESRTHEFHRGDAIAEITPRLEKVVID